MSVFIKTIDFIGALFATLTSLASIVAIPIMALAWGKSGSSAVSFFIAIPFCIVFLIACTICLWKVWANDSKILENGIKNNPYLTAFLSLGLLPFIVFSFAGFATARFEFNLGSLLFFVIPLCPTITICKHLIKLVKCSFRQNCYQS